MNRMNVHKNALQKYVKDLKNHPFLTGVPAHSALPLSAARSRNGVSVKNPILTPHFFVSKIECSMLGHGSECRHIKNQRHV
jgi:hypothetical protein